MKYSDLDQSETIHIFEYYDFPLFFISRSPNNKYFLNYYIEEITDNIDKWLYSRITKKELQDLIELRTSVLDLLNRLLEKKRLYHLFIDSTTSDSEAEVKIDIVDSSNFDPESFPEEDFFVEYDYVTKQKLVKIEHDIIDSSKFKMVLKDSENSHDIGLDFFLGILNNLKKSINDIAHDIESKVLGERSSNTVNLRVDSLQPSSFGIWLKTDPIETDLFEVPEKSLNNLFGILNDIRLKKPSEIEDQIEIDEEYSIETIKSIKNFLKDIVENEFSLKLEGTTKLFKVHKEVLFDKETYNKLDVLTNILKKKSEKYKEKIELEGILTSVNTTSNHFKISTLNGDFGGKMSREIFRTVKDSNITFKVPSKIKATVEKEIIKDYVEDEISEKFILINFEQPE